MHRPGGALAGRPNSHPKGGGARQTFPIEDPHSPHEIRELSCLIRRRWHEEANPRFDRRTSIESSHCAHPYADALIGVESVACRTVSSSYS
jgi:hypothetical protein